MRLPEQGQGANMPPGVPGCRSGKPSCLSSATWSPAGLAECTDMRDLAVCAFENVLAQRWGLCKAEALFGLPLAGRSLGGWAPKRVSAGFSYR